MGMVVWEWWYGGGGMGIVMGMVTGMVGLGMDGMGMDCDWINVGCNGV